MYSMYPIADSLGQRKNAEWLILCQFGEFNSEYHAHLLGGKEWMQFHRLHFYSLRLC